MNRKGYHITCLLLSTVLIIGCNSQFEQEVDADYSEENMVISDTQIVEKVQIWQNRTDTSYGFGQGNDIINGWMPDNFDVLLEEEFLALQEVYHQSIIKDSSLVKFKDSLFTIQTSKAQISYNHMSTPKYGGHNLAVYEGFVEPFKLYLISHWHESSILSGSMSMIDSVSNIQYRVVSVSDGPTEIPIASHDSKYLMVYSYNYHYSNITILERVEQGNTGNFTELTSFSINGLVRDLGWLENNRISFKLDYQNYFDKSLSKIGYYKSKLPIDELVWKKNSR